MNTHAAALKRAISTPGRALAMPGCYDALSAVLIQQAGFESAILSGASIAYTRLGAPDIGLVSAAEVADVVATIRDRVPNLPLVVDADDGYGNALNVQRTVRTFERAGASAIMLEDQAAPKRCGHLAGKRLISAAEMTGKLHAALDARADASTLIVARTDALGVEGFAAAMDRAALYVEAGADLLFVEAPQSVEQMREICARFGDRLPLVANMVEGGATPIRSMDDLAEIGFRVVYFGGAAVRVITAALQQFFADLKADGSSRAWTGRMLDLQGLNALLGTEGILEAGRRYDENIAAAGFEPAKSPANG